MGQLRARVVRSIVVEIPGIAEQTHGLANTAVGPVSGGRRRDDASGVISSPARAAHALDTSRWSMPLLTAIFHQLDEQR